ncbi:tyrosinase family oxidase copper chaperone [Actinoplanes sp. NPDC049681]|uniref:tyrosinase family oxidase copper chaperone n=1 Tax=Actinoplanes sp. NPDC049681 TaxID=3363905 RepID=UPI00378C9B50
MSTMNRRELLKFAAAGTVAVGTGALAVQVLTTSGSQAAVEGTGATGLDETYKGRRIQAAPAGLRAQSRDAAPAMPHVLIDGKPLHVMVNADGTYTSVSNHYETFKSLRAVARAAVDQLDGAQLVPLHHG